MGVTALGGRLHYGDSVFDEVYLNVISFTLPTVSYPKVASKKQNRTFEEYSPGVPDYGEATVVYESTEAAVSAMDALRGGAIKHWRYVLPAFGQVAFHGIVMANDSTLADVNQFIEHTVKIAATDPVYVGVNE